MIRQNKFIILVLLLSPGFMKSNPILESAEKVLDVLYNQYGDTRIEKPTLEIVDSKSFVAAYYPGSNSIKVENKALEVCQDFGENTDAALAFIIGHELAHAFQDHLDDHEHTSFLAYNEISCSLSKQQLIKKEQQADIFGAFGAYVAGYRIHRVFPDLLNSIYDAYTLNDDILVKYPPLAVRTQSANEVKNQVDSLTHLFDIALKLSLTGEYEKSALCYERIIDQFGGNNILNNAGANYLLQAIHLPSYNVDPFVFPIEINAATRLHKAKKTGDSKDLNPEEMSQRIKLIEKGQKLLKKAIYQNPLDPAAVNNYAISYALLENYQEALALLQTKKSNIDFEDYPALTLTEALVQELQGVRASNPQKALQNLAQSGDARISDFAKINLDIMEGTLEPASLPSLVSCEYSCFDHYDLSGSEAPKAFSISVSNDLQIKSWSLNNDKQTKVHKINVDDGFLYLVQNNDASLINGESKSVYLEAGAVLQCTNPDKTLIHQYRHSKESFYVIKP